jgi:hypothetical protein
VLRNFKSSRPNRTALKGGTVQTQTLALVVVILVPLMFLTGDERTSATAWFSYFCAAAVLAREAIQAVRRRLNKKG